MFIAAKYGVLNSEYIREICIRYRECLQDNNQDACSFPVTIVAEMNDKEEKILYGCDTEEEAQKEMTKFMAYMTIREKEIERSHDFFVFGSDFCIDVFPETLLDEMKWSQVDSEGRG